MFKFFDYIAGLLQGGIDLIMKAAVWIITKLFIMILPMFEWLFETLVEMVANLITASNTLSQFASAWAGLPQEILYIATILQIPAAMTIILSAYVVRIVIKLIPGI